MKRSPNASRALSEEERILWNRVARTAVPLKGKAGVEDEEIAEAAPAPVADLRSVQAEMLLSPARPRNDAARPATPRPLDRPTTDRLAKGRLPIEARVDLHGLTQAEAHALLLSFLHRAHAMEVRHVLVITGKGSSLGSDGALRRAVPAWFTTPAFRTLVGGYESAARHHGGGGALYVRVRRQSGGKAG